MNISELVFSFRRVKGAKSYIYQYAPEPITDNTVWQSKTGTTTSVILTQLKSCIRYQCRVVAVGVRKQQVISDCVGRVVQ